jgi:hypothetical protein
MIRFYYSKGFVWFRILGYGLHFKNIKMHGLTFSERTFKKFIKLPFGWRVIYLRP